MAWSPILEGGFEGQGGTLVGWIDEAGNRHGPDETPPTENPLPAGVQSVQIPVGGFEGQATVAQGYTVLGRAYPDEYPTQISGTASNGYPGGVTRNPFTGGWEKTYYATSASLMLPESIARQLGGPLIEYYMPPDGGGDALEKFIVPAALAFVTWGASTAFGGALAAGAEVGATAATADALSVAGDIASNAFPVAGVTPGFTGAEVGALSIGPEALTAAGDIGGNAFPVEGVTPGFTGTVGEGSALTLSDLVPKPSPTSPTSPAPTSPPPVTPGASAGGLVDKVLSGAGAALKAASGALLGSLVHSANAAGLDNAAAPGVVPAASGVPWRLVAAGAAVTVGLALLGGVAAKQRKKG